MNILYFVEFILMPDICKTLCTLLQYISEHYNLTICHNVIDCWLCLCNTSVACDSHRSVCDWLWITNISAWAIERATIEIIVNHKHFCVSYRAFYYWNYCESQTFLRELSSVLLLKLLWSQTFLRELSSVLLLKLLWITNISACTIERATIEIIVNHKHLWGPI